MSNVFELSVEKRELTGKGASRRLRRLVDKVPAIMYGGGDEPMMLSLAQKDMRKALESEAFYSSVLTLNVGGEKQQVVLKDMQRHPSKPVIMHVDFLRINANEAITMRVPLHFLGGDVAPGVKLNDGMMTHLIAEVEVSCLPADLPEFIELDLSKMELDETMHLRDIVTPKGVTLTEINPDHPTPVASIHKKREIVEPEAETLEGETGEGQAPAAEGETGEGETKE